MLVAINEDDSLPSLSRSSFQRILKDLQFEYVKKNRNSALLEREDLITWRRGYLDKIRHYRSQNRPIYYLDETGSTQARRITGHGSIPRSSHHEMHSSMASPQDKSNPPGKDNAVIVMDNASYHSVKKHKIPVMSWKKQDIIDWLESKGEVIKHSIVKVDLMKKVRKIKKQYDQYLNPIELEWSSVKSYVRTHNNTFKLKDVQELLKKGVDHVTPEMWTNFVGHVIKEEEKFWNIEHTTDELIDNLPEEGARHVLLIGTGDTSSSSDYDSD
ncbi:unnamed protein product [Macrosiphum euphorbiae]|uniref:Tc1-like transposase DDE domain-containing protein n=1 Tax=Macrosiphum euphorbiae TaxID=13131 RepID=A0AAV0WCY7_9HEMI|nr:unnamed protein product [Macrosiphum euphorbiae]